MIRIETKRYKSKRNSPKRNEIYLVSFRFCFVSIYFASFRFVSFRFRFAFYRYSIFEPFIHILQHFVLQLSRSTNFSFQVQLPCCNSLVLLTCVSRSSCRIAYIYIISNTAAGPRNKSNTAAGSRNKSQQKERVVTRNVVKYGYMVQRYTSASRQRSIP